MSDDYPVTVDVRFGGYSVLGLPPERTLPEVLPVPPGTSDPLAGAVEVVEGGAFVWALQEVYEDEHVEFSFVTSEPPDDPPPRSVIRRFEFEATGPVVVNTFEWEYVATLPLPTGRLALEILMMPRGRDGFSREAHHLRMVPA